MCLREREGIYVYVVGSVDDGGQIGQGMDGRAPPLYIYIYSPFLALPAVIASFLAN